VATEKVMEAGVMVAQSVHDNVDEDTQKKIEGAASTALQYAHAGAQQVAIHGDKVLQQGYQNYTTVGKVVDTAVNQAYAGLPEEKRRVIEERRKRVEEGREHVKALVMDLSKPVRKQAFAAAGQSIKAAAVSDPDMWPFMRTLTGELIDTVWEDIEEEAERGLEMGIFKDLAPEQQVAMPFEGPLWKKMFLRTRAFVLHHFLPFDKSIYGMLKDPFYLLFFGITCIPFYSARVFFYSLILLLLATSPDGVDEYQLIGFILSSKGMQFLTSGVLQNALGAGQYYYAIHFCDLQEECIARHTPGQGEPLVFALIDFFGSVSLVWMAFYLLPRSSKHGLQTERATLRQQTMPEFQRSALLASGTNRGTGGGRLRGSLHWDLACFVLCSAGLVALQSCTAWAEFLANLFWCRVVYSMLSFPFFIFFLPGFRQLLTHAEPTGFARDGRCVPYKLRALPEAAQPLLGTGASSPSSAGA